MRNIFMESVRFSSPSAAELLVHGIAGRGRAEMGQPGAGEVEMRRIGMADRRRQPPLRVGGGEVDRFAETLRSSSTVEARAGARGLQRQRIDAAGAVDQPGAAADARDDAWISPPVDQLGNQHVLPPHIALSVDRRNAFRGETDLPCRSIARRVAFAGPALSGPRRPCGCRVPCSVPLKPCSCCRRRRPRRRAAPGL